MKIFFKEKCDFIKSSHLFHYIKNRFSLNLCAVEPLFCRDVITISSYLLIIYICKFRIRCFFLSCSHWRFILFHYKNMRLNGNAKKDRQLKFEKNNLSFFKLIFRGYIQIFYQQHRHFTIGIICGLS